MGSFRDQMAEDWSQFTDSDGFGEQTTATYVPEDGGGASFPLAVTVGDEQPSVAQFDGGIEGRRNAQIHTQWSVVQAGLTQVLGTYRNPVRGDAIVIADGPNVGRWIVSAMPALDVGDGAVFDVILSTFAAPGGRGAREIR